MNSGRYMTETEELRADICSKITQKKISQSNAALELGISLRQVKRLYASFLKEGIAGLASKQRGKPSNRQFPPVKKARIQELVTCEKYRGFGPTFMCEKLQQLHGIKVSVETTRQLMMQSGVWADKAQKRPVIHQQRERRALYGELTQIDGSPHDWFEGRRDKCCGPFNRQVRQID